METRFWNVICCKKLSFVPILKIPNLRQILVFSKINKYENFEVIGLNLGKMINFRKKKKKLNITTF